MGFELLRVGFEVWCHNHYPTQIIASDLYFEFDYIHGLWVSIWFRNKVVPLVVARYEFYSMPPIVYTRYYIDVWFHIVGSNNTQIKEHLNKCHINPCITQMVDPFIHMEYEK